jgi:hypothetical protein
LETEVKLVLCAALMGLSIAAHAEELAAKAMFFDSGGALRTVPTPPGGPDVPVGANPRSASRPSTAMAAAGTQAGAAKPRNAPVAASAGIGASYFIRLQHPDGKSEDVLATHNFRTGDKFQLGVKVNRASYVYIFNEDAAGNLTALYPQPGQPERIDAMGVVFLPTRGSFQFHGPAGVETMSIYIAQTAVADLRAQIANAPPDLMLDAPALRTSGKEACSPEPTTNRSTQVAEVAQVALASKGIEYVRAESNCAASIVLASKAIVFADDPAPTAGGQVSSYVVKPNARPQDYLLMRLRLVHR